MNRTEAENTTKSPFDENGWNIYPLARVCNNSLYHSVIYELYGMNNYC